MHVRALEIACEYLPEILPAADDLSRQMIQSGPGIVDQVDAEQLDDEKVIVRPTLLAGKLVVLRPDTGLVLPSYLMTLLDAQKHFGKRASCTMLLNAFSPGPSGLRLRPS
jgi:hypothetical protein